MNIVQDIDGCIADWNSNFARTLLRIQPIQLDIYDDKFPLVWRWPEHYGFTKETIERAWTEVKNSGLFWKSLHPYVTAWDDLKFLDFIKQNHNVYFVTNRPGRTALQETIEWLEGRGFENPSVTISDKKHLFCEAVGADLIIDDSPDNLLKIKYKTKTILFKRPYNEGYWGYFNGTVDSIREALKNVT